ncbi:MAG: alpha/beta fold hydrolase [Propionibacteriaceae bacterium]|nr:alpha/beta fold hydrolase [Propionibacteriaceae bacterium]
MAVSIDVSWQVDGIEMYGTVVRPDGLGPFPGVVLVAGSGPTDRDWCSPLLPGENGAGKLFAGAFAAAGFASMRYDKRASGPHVMENLPQLIGKMSMASHLDELTSAVDAFVAQGFVDATRLIGFGNSEGTLHVLHYATGGESYPFAGVVLAAPPGRPVRELLLMQLRLQLSQTPGGDDMMVLVEQACARYEEGQSMDPDPSLPEQLRMVLLSFDTPANLPLARELFGESACDTLPRVTVPTLVLIGGKDFQVDAQADGAALRTATLGMPNVTFAFPPDANHVFKHETRTPAEIVAGGTAYNDADTNLDAESLRIILDWIAGVTSVIGEAPTV